MLKSETKKDLVNSDSPLVFWCYALERRMKIINATPRDNYLQKGECPQSQMTGQPYDISAFCSFGLYEWIKFRHHGEQFPYPTERLGRCLGPSDDAGNGMSQYVLTDRGTVITVQTIRSLTPAEVNSPVEARKRDIFDKIIVGKFGNSRYPHKNWNTRNRDKVDPDIDDSEVLNQDGYALHNISIVSMDIWETDVDEGREHVPIVSDDEDDDNHIKELSETDDIPDLDVYLSAEVLLPQNGEHLKAATVTRRVTNENGVAIGTYNQNPILDTRVYEVMFPDGATQQYAANVIAENIYAQIDEEGHRYQLLEGILHHRKTSKAVTKDQAMDKSGKNRLTTKGWDFCVEWKDGTFTWVPLKDLKNSHPIECAEYAVMAGIQDEPAFAWWVKHTLRKRDQIISVVRSRLKKKTHKFGIEIPATVEEAYRLDAKNKNTFWRDAIAKEMKNVRVAFEVLPEGAKPPPTYKRLECYMVFDVKMDFTRKARFVANGSKTSDPEGSKYAGVVSRESVRIALTYAALMGLSVLSADIQNAYLQAPTSEKFWTECGPEFGSEEQGRIAIVVRALYGTKSSGRDFRNHLRDCMEHMQYRSCLGDPDVWLREAVMDDGTKYYEYVLLYVDDTLCLSEHPKEALLELNKYFGLKKTKKGEPLIESPSIYLGGKLSQVELPNGVVAWAVSSSQYVQEAVRNLELHLKGKGKSLRKGTNSPLSQGYQPECDISPVISAEEGNYFQSLIGIARWAVELGRVDICCETSMLSSFVAMPREGHMEQMCHMFAYLKRHHNARMVLDPSYPEIDDKEFIVRDWTDFYGKLKEDIPPNAPKPRGKEFIMREFVDASHADNKVNRRSRTGFIVMLNNAPVYWFSKKQGGVETSSFGSEFIAMKTACEYVRGLRYKLRMMGIRVTNPSFIYGDNKSVLWNVTIPDSMLKKKCHGISYHFCREGAARGEWVAGYINTKENPGDIFTKNLPPGENRYRKVKSILYDIYDNVGV